MEKNWGDTPIATLSIENTSLYDIILLYNCFIYGGQFELLLIKRRLMIQILSLIEINAQLS